MRMVVAAVLLCGAVAACGDRDSSGSAAPPGLAASIQQWREDEVNGVLQVKVINGTAGALHVERTGLEWIGFSQPTSNERSAVIVAGDRTDLPVPVVPARCTVPPHLHDTGPTQPAIAVLSAGGHVFRVPVADPTGVLARVHLQDCDRQTVFHQAAVGFDRQWTDGTYQGRPAKFGVLRVTRAEGDAEVDVDDIDGSVLLQVEAPDGGNPLLRLAAGAAEATMPVVILSTTRCEPHALADSKKTYDFQLALTVDGAPVNISVTPDVADRPVVYQTVVDFCPKP